MRASKIEPFGTVMTPMSSPAVIRGPSKALVAPTPGGNWLRKPVAPTKPERSGLTPMSPKTPSSDALTVTKKMVLSACRSPSRWPELMTRFTRSPLKADTEPLGSSEPLLITTSPMPLAWLMMLPA